MLVFVPVLWEGIDMKSVEDLDVFKLAHHLALQTYSATKSFPRTETFGPVDQMRRVRGIRGIRVRLE